MDDEYEDDHDRHDSGHNGYGAPYAPQTSSDHGKHEKTSAFNTLVSDNGKFFGFTLDPQLASALNVMYATGLTHASEWAEKYATKLGGASAGNLAAYGVIFGKQIYETLDNVYKSSTRLNDLRVAMRPLAKSGANVASTSPLSGDNEVVANARGKISGIFWNSNIQTIVGTVGAGSALFTKLSQTKANIRENAKLKKIKAAKDPKEIAKILQEETNIVASSLEGVNSNLLREAKEIWIEDSRKLYEAKFEAFKEKNAHTLKKEVNAILDELNDGNYNGHLAKLKRLGVSTDGLSEEIRDIRNNYNHRISYARKGDTIPELSTQITDAVKRFKGDAMRTPGRKNSSRKDGYLEDALRAKFVKQHGAFSREDLDVLNQEDRNLILGNKEKPATEIDQIEADIKKMQDVDAAKKNKEKEAGKDMSAAGENMTKGLFGLIAGGLGEQLKSAVGAKAIEQYKKPIALDRILNLRRVLEEGKDQPPETIPAAQGSGDKDMSYVQYVHSVFQQHQKDCNRPDIGDRFLEHFEKARWNDDEINKLPDDELNPYEYAVKTIAKRIKDGRMDAIALVELVGDKHKKIVRNDGRSFGPLGAGKDDAAAKESIKKIIDEKTALIHAGQTQTEEQINDKLGNFIFSVEDMKKALDSNELQKEERAFLFTVFSDVVGTDAKLCQKLGIKAERCQKLRSETKETFNNLLDGAVLELANMIEHQPEELEKKLKLTDKEKQLIQTLAEKVKEENKNVSDLTENRDEIKSLETVVANATMKLAKEPGEPGEDGKPKNFWQRMVSAAKEQKEAIQNHAKNKKEEAAAHKHGDPEDEFEDKPKHKKSIKNEKHSHDFEEEDHGLEREEGEDKKWADKEEKAWPSEMEGKYTSRERNKDSKEFDTRLAP